jgi:hypothetical protein
MKCLQCMRSLYEDYRYGATESKLCMSLLAIYIITCIVIIIAGIVCVYKFNCVYDGQTLIIYGTIFMLIMALAACILYLIGYITKSEELPM